MREILSEIVKQSMGLFDTVKVTGTEEEIKVEAVHPGLLLFLKASLKPSPDLMGVFGLTNLDMLRGLLDFASYKTEGSKFLVKRDVKPKVGDTVVAFQFVDPNGTGAKFATMNPALIPEQAGIGKIDWEVQIPTTKPKITEFTQLTNLYKSTDELFRANIADRNLIFSIGDNHESTHNASMVFATEVDGKLSKDTMKWNSGMMLNLLKVATMDGVSPTLSISGRGPMGVSVTTPIGSYNYILRTDDGKKKK
jgi:hypothetical protein